MQIRLEPTQPVKITFVRDVLDTYVVYTDEPICVEISPDHYIIGIESLSVTDGQLSFKY